MSPIDTAAVLAVPRDQIPAVLGELRRVEAILQVRLLTPEPPDKLLTAEEAAPLLAISPDTPSVRGHGQHADQGVRKPLGKP